jgi:hypothetical protein
MFRNIFKRRGTIGKNKRPERGFAAAPAQASKRAASQYDPAVQVDITVDEAMAALSRELSGLAHLEVGQAAKERGWAALQRELQHRPVRTAAPVMAKSVGARGAVHAGAGPQARTVHSGSQRWLLGSAAAVAVAVIVTVSVVYSGGGEGPTVVSNPPSTSTVTSVVSSDSTLPDTTLPTGETTIPTDETTVPTGGSTDTSVGPDTTGSTTDTSVGPDTTGSTTNTTKSPATTQPSQTTTTNEQQMAAAQLEKDAVAAALSLGAEVADVYFRTGDLTGARRLVASGAQADLIQMVSTLTAPTGFRKVGAKTVDSSTVRVTLEFSDSIPDGRGGLGEVTKRFLLIVRVNDDGAKITAISKAGS